MGLVWLLPLVREPYLSVLGWQQANMTIPLALGPLALLVGLCLATGVASAAEYSGSVDRIVDGDTLWLCDATACHKIRVCGINAPEKGQPGYRDSGAALENLVKGKAVRCVQVGNGTPCDGRSKPTNRDRIVAQCFVDGADIAATLVEQGFACDWIKFSGGVYSQKGTGNHCKVAVQPGAARSLEAETLARIEELDRSVRAMSLDASTTERLLREGKEALLRSYCLQSRLQE
jgi:endonuclease YncB( thermonuclease family)